MSDQYWNRRDQDLGGKDQLKLVRYKILFIKRDLEYAFPEEEELVSDELDERGFAVWKAAEFIQRLKDVDVPKKWVARNYPRKFPDPNAKGLKIESLPDQDKKYLRVYFEVLDRFDREDAEYERQQVEVLREIRDSMR